MDKHTPEQRRRNMQAVKNKDSAIELMLRLAFLGFPKDYRLPDIPQKEKYKQIGNTVCVPLVEQIAERLI